MKGLPRANWIFASVTWGLAAFSALSNLFAWEPAWYLSCMIWVSLAPLSAILSVSTMFTAFFEDDPVEKKACVRSSVMVIAISALVAVLMIFVFSKWFGFGELSGEC